MYNLLFSFENLASEKILLIALITLLVVTAIICIACTVIITSKIKALANKPTEVVAVQPVAQPLPEVKEETESAEKVDDAVTFSSEKGQTLDEKYQALDDEMKNNYDQIINYASAVDGARKFKNLRYEEYKIGSLRIVRLLIKRGIVVCEFMMHNTDFKSYVSENKVSVKQSATVIKVTDSETVQVIKDTIDIVVKAIGEERDFKKQLAKEKRKAKRENA